MFTKEKIFNLALSALLLQRQVVDANTDTSPEAKVLRQWYDVAIRMALAEMDLDETSSQITLELVATDPVHGWCFAYKYPSNCAFFRRLQSCAVIDSKYTHISKRVAQFNGQKVIFTNKERAIAEFIPTNLDLANISPAAGAAIALRLATLSAPLITGKGAAKLIEKLNANYIATKAEAQAKDQQENFSFQTDETISEFVAVRTS